VISVRRLIPPAAVLCALASTAALAHASAGPLEPVGCVAWDKAPIEGCASARAMGNSAYLGITPDGKNVYVSARNVDAVAAFARNRTTGGLEQLPGTAGCISDSGAPIEGCAVAAGLDRPAQMASSPDGKNLYVGGTYSNSIVSFTRNPETGELTQTGCFTDVDRPDPDCVTTPGMRTPTGVTISPDGAFVYVAAYDSDAIAWFSRDLATGALTPAGCVSKAVIAGCATRAPGIDAATAIAISRDGASLYVASPDSNSIAAFARDPATGALTSVGCISGDDGAGRDPACAAGHEVDYPQFVAIAPDGLHVYVSATDVHTIIILARDPITGALTQSGCVSDIDDAVGVCDLPAVGLDLPLGIAITSTGRFVYTGAFGYGSVASFERDPASGMLSQFGPCYSTEDDDCLIEPQLGRAGFIALSPDDRQLYVNAPNSSTVSVFARTTSSTAPAITTSKAKIHKGRAPVALACPSDADGGCIGTLELESQTRNAGVGFKIARYDLLAGGTSTVKVKVKITDSNGHGPSNVKALAVTAGTQPGDQIGGESRVIKVVGG
jgi:6-phosphogluconolactonase (cycloisomerase 2 family)